MDIFDELERDRERARGKPVRPYRARFSRIAIARGCGGALAIATAFAAGVWLRPVLPIDGDDSRGERVVVPLETIDGILGRTIAVRETGRQSRDSDLAVRNALASRRAVGQFEEEREAAAGVLAELESEHARRIERLNDARAKSRGRASDLARIESEAEDAVAMAEAAVRNARETQSKLERSAYRALMAVSAAFNNGDDTGIQARELRRRADRAKARLDEVKRYAKNPRALIVDLRKRAQAAARRTGKARGDLAEARRAEVRAKSEARETADAINRASQSYMASTRRVSRAHRTAELAAWDAIALSAGAKRAASIDAYEKLVDGLSP